MKTLLTVFFLMTAACVAQENEKTPPIAIQPDGPLYATGGGNGGSGLQISSMVQLSDIQRRLAEIFKYLKEGKALELSELVDLDYMEMIIGDLKIELTEEELFDKYGNPSTCLNFPAEILIQCNTQAYSAREDRVKHVLVFHEVLGLMGLEEGQRNPEQIGESYKYSSKLIPHLKLKSFYTLEGTRYDDSYEVQINNYGKSRKYGGDRIYPPSCKVRFIHFNLAETKQARELFFLELSSRGYLLDSEIVQREVDKKNSTVFYYNDSIAEGLSFNGSVEEGGMDVWPYDIFSRSIQITYGIISNGSLVEFPLFERLDNRYFFKYGPTKARKIFYKNLPACGNPK